MTARIGFKIPTGAKGAQVDHPPLGGRVALNVSLGRRQRRMAGELLHVPKRTARLNDLLGATSDERASAAMARRTLEAERRVEPMKPNLDGARRHADIAFGMDDAIGRVDVTGGFQRC